jgi:cell division protein FtsN
MLSTATVTPNTVLRDIGRTVRLIGCLGVLATLAACASGPKVSAVQEARQYQSRARGNYTPPGPKSDPWGPYIMEASAKYDLPDRWIREVIRAESSGKVMETSGPGAMGLMQVMPATFDELRGRYDLGEDPYDPHDNIMAGTAYLREMYDLYGNPGFLAAYNAGPGRYDDYLTRNKGLPTETRNYVAKIAPRIQGAEPNRASPATQYAMNVIPMNIPAGPRYPKAHQAPVALADTRRSGFARGAVQTASLPEPPRQPTIQAPPQTYAALQPMPQPAGAASGRQTFRLIPRAMADTMPQASGGATTWAIQVGAFGNENMARAAADTARQRVQSISARSTIGTTKLASNTLYRARVTGLSREAAVQACEKMGKGQSNCIVLSPDAQG